MFANQKPFGESENHRDSFNEDDLATRQMWNIATTDLVNAVGRQSGDLLTAMVIYIVVHGILFNPVFVLLVVGFLLTLTSVTRKLSENHQSCQHA